MNFNVTIGIISSLYVKRSIFFLSICECLLSEGEREFFVQIHLISLFWRKWKPDDCSSPVKLPPIVRVWPLAAICAHAMHPFR